MFGHFSEGLDVFPVLDQLTRVQRFSTIIMFLSPKYKQSMRSCIFMSSAVSHFEYIVCQSKQTTSISVTILVSESLWLLLLIFLLHKIANFWIFQNVLNEMLHV